MRVVSCCDTRVLLGTNLTYQPQSDTCCPLSHPGINMQGTIADRCLPHDEVLDDNMLDDQVLDDYNWLNTKHEG